MMTKEPDQRLDSRRDRRSRSVESEDGDYLTPSESEPEDIVGLSRAPVSRRQIAGLRKQEEARVKEFGVDSTANLPVYYSLGGGHKKSGTKGFRDGHGQKEVPRGPLTTNTRTGNRRNESLPDSSSSDDDDNSDFDDRCHERRDKFRRKEGNQRRKRDSSKENESEDDERPFGSRRNMKQVGKEEERWLQPYERTKDRRHRKGYINSDKYDGMKCFKTFLTQFSNCADYNGWSESEKLSYLKWCLK